MFPSYLPPPYWVLISSYPFIPFLLEIHNVVHNCDIYLKRNIMQEPKIMILLFYLSNIPPFLANDT